MYWYEIVWVIILMLLVSYSDLKASLKGNRKLKICNIKNQKIMLPVDFEGSNLTLHRPQDMRDEECMSIKAHLGIDNDGYHFVLTAWQPNKEDIEAINAGRPIMLKVIGSSMPPVAIYTFDEDFNCNSPR
jgi:hypothetical protein